MGEAPQATLPPAHRLMNLTGVSLKMGIRYKLLLQLQPQASFGDFYSVDAFGKLVPEAAFATELGDQVAVLDVPNPRAGQRDAANADALDNE